MLNGSTIDKFGNEFWWKNDLRHRENGPAIITASGNKYYYIEDVLHRDGGPAIEYITSGIKKWYKMGLLHREDGPAIETNMEKYNEYWYNGKKIECNSTEEFVKLLKFKAFW